MRGTPTVYVYIRYDRVFIIITIFITPIIIPCDVASRSTEQSIFADYSFLRNDMRFGLVNLRLMIFGPVAALLMSLSINGLRAMGPVAPVAPVAPVLPVLPVPPVPPVDAITSAVQTVGFVQNRALLAQTHFPRHSLLSQW